MTSSNDSLWQTKVAARLHDPAEKALVLLRDPAGHENGTSRALSRLLGLTRNSGARLEEDEHHRGLAPNLFERGLPVDAYRHVQRADWWAAAADRPQWPLEEITVPTANGQTRTLRVAPWAQVRWTKQTVLIHPLSGESFDLSQSGSLASTDFHDIKERSFAHHSSLLAALDKQAPGQQDWKKILLTLWRFAPELRETQNNDTLGELWKLLPADTRIPDHSIWDHLDLTSAFAGAFAADPNGEAALLTLSIGPVQSFIAAARKMEDLWAGSHLLARLSWEAMRVVCEALGPDAILFPRLRGVPQVDLWLRDQCGVPAELFADCSWNRGRTDSNPLFAAALPNRFVAIVPASRAKSLALAAEAHVHGWLRQKGEETIARLLDAVGLENTPDQYCHQQLRQQLDGFPEVHWASVPFSLIKISNVDRQTGLDTSELSSAMQPFFGILAGEPCGFLATPAWQLLQKELLLKQEDGSLSVFFAPNPGVLYPAIHDLAERALAAAKAIRPFRQSTQEGWRCSLGGDTEWLTTDKAHLTLPAGKRMRRNDPRFEPGVHQETLWAQLADKKPAWAKKGEHLGALPAIKRLWPTLFAEEVARASNQSSIGRFVVSTHTMALAHQLDQWLQHGGLSDPDLAALQQQHRTRLEPVALPRELMRRHQAASPEALKDAALLPALLDLANDGNLGEPEAAAIRRAVRRTLSRTGATAHDPQTETYYALLLMDGDRMGAWLAGAHQAEDGVRGISYLESFHPQVREGFKTRAAAQPALQSYGNQVRALSPNRHLAISGALNDFSLTIVRHVVEREYLGRLIYAGGDDVLAMLPVADVLAAMQRLRHAYSGHDPLHEGGRDPRGLTLHKGFAYLDNRLMRMMGTRASASCGVVIAHHQAPLSAVRRQLAAAEQRAKTEGKRDAFSITILKRSGGALELTDRWDTSLPLLQALRDFLQQGDVSRRAAYHTLQWLDPNALPCPEGDGALLQSMLSQQLKQQSGKQAAAADLARRLTAATLKKPTGQRISWLRNFIAVAEFLARELRSSSAGDAP